MKNDWTKSVAVTLLILMAAFSRIIPHPSNFTAIGAVGIFSAVVVSNRLLALSLPLIAMWVSDLVINNIVYSSPSGFMWFTQGLVWIYLGIVAHCLSAWWLAKRQTVPNIVAASAMGALLFFLLSNFGVWIGSTMYPHTPAGLAMCYAAGIPFFGNMLAGDLFFGIVLFGIYFLLKNKAKVFQAA